MDKVENVENVSTVEEAALKFEREAIRHRVIAAVSGLASTAVGAILVADIIADEASFSPTEVVLFSLVTGTSAMAAVANGARARIAEQTASTLFANNVISPKAHEE